MSCSNRKYNFCVFLCVLVCPLSNSSMIRGIDSHMEMQLSQYEAAAAAVAAAAAAAATPTASNSSSSSSASSSSSTSSSPTTGGELNLNNLVSNGVKINGANPSLLGHHMTPSHVHHHHAAPSAPMHTTTNNNSSNSLNINHLGLTAAAAASQLDSTGGNNGIYII